MKTFLAFLVTFMLGVVVGQAIVRENHGLWRHKQEIPDAQGNH